MATTSKYVVKSFLWGSVAKVLDAGIKIVSIPLLLNYYGKEDFGLIALAISVNAYLSLLDMGVNSGGIKFFSEWIVAKKMDLLDSVARTSITFYAVIGILNALFLVIIAFFGMNMFSITAAQVPIMRNLFLILAIFAVINWTTSVYNLLLTANLNMAFIQQVNILRSLLGLALIVVTIKMHFNLTIYFTLFTLVNSLVLFPFYIKARKHGLIKNPWPAFDWPNFSKIFKYSLAIIAMAIFSWSAMKSRPIILSMFSAKGIGILTDFRIMETITLFITNIGGMFLSIFLPKTSSLLLENDNEKVAAFAYKATLYTSIVCVLLCLPFLLSSQEIISVYVGKKFVYLSGWLSLWVITILFSLHNSPVASLILATGKTRMLVYSSATGCVISIIINAILCKMYGAGSAVFGYAVYILITMSFSYLYVKSKILRLNSWKIFKSFIIPASIGFGCLALVWLMNIHLPKLLPQIIVKTVIWSVLFVGVLFVTKVVSVNEFKSFMSKKPAL